MTPSPKKKSVLVFGTFDRLHPGHKYFLQQAKKLGDKLFVVVTRDSVVVKKKKLLPEQSQAKRQAALKKIKSIYKVMLGNKKVVHKYALVKKINPDVICLGYDQANSIKKIMRDLRRLKLNTSVIRLKSFFPERYKSSILRKNMSPKPLLK